MSKQPNPKGTAEQVFGTPQHLRSEEAPDILPESDPEGRPW